MCYLFYEEKLLMYWGFKKGVFFMVLGIGYTCEHVNLLTVVPVVLIHPMHSGRLPSKKSHVNLTMTLIASKKNNFYHALNSDLDVNPLNFF